MSEVSITHFTKEFLTALEEGNGAIFVGAGLSVESGHVNWKESMRGLQMNFAKIVERYRFVIVLVIISYSYRFIYPGLNVFFDVIVNVLARTVRRVIALNNRR